MICRACWLNDLDKQPCIDSRGCQYDIAIPTKVTLRCYVMMTQSWSRPGGRMMLITKLDGLPVSCLEGRLSSKVIHGELDASFQFLSEDRSEVRKIVDLALEILPSSSPWMPFLEKGRLIMLERSVVIEHAPFIVDDGQCREAYAEDMRSVNAYGPEQKVETWGDWFELLKEKEREKDAKRKKSDWGS